MLVVLAAILVLAPWLSWLPLSAMAALLLLVAWNMSEAHRWWICAPGAQTDVLVLLVCLSLTVIFDMVIAITFGVILAFAVHARDSQDDQAAQPGGSQTLCQRGVPRPLSPDQRATVLCRRRAGFDELLAQVKDHKELILQMEAVSILMLAVSPPSSSSQNAWPRRGSVSRWLNCNSSPQDLARAKVRPVAGELEFYGSLEEAIRGEHLHEAVEN